MSEGEIGWLREAIADLQHGQEEILRHVTDARLNVARHDELIAATRSLVADTIDALKAESAKVNRVEQHMMSTAECLRLRTVCAAERIRAGDIKTRHLSLWIAFVSVVVAAAATVLPYVIS